MYSVHILLAIESKPIEYVCWALKYVKMNKLLDIEFIC